MEELTLKIMTNRIKEEKCILFLGPEIFTMDGKTISEQLEDYFSTNNYKCKGYYSDDEFFSFAEPIDKQFAYFCVQEFYKNLKPKEFHKLIAEIPFHLIISVSPDSIMKEVYEELKFPYIFDFYNKEKNPQKIGKPSSKRPLIYNLFGSYETEGSLILTYDDLFDYLFAIFGKHNLHNDLMGELTSAKLILFLGFKFEKWYFKLLLRLLNLHKDKLNYADKSELKLLPQLENFYTEQFKFNFLDCPQIDIVRALYKKCEEEGILKTRPVDVLINQPEIFISYSRQDCESVKVSDELVEILKSRNYNVIRDKENCNYLDDVKKFMQKLSSGNYVILVICDKYLRSPFCMYEMLHIQQKEGFENRIFPIVLKDARIYNEEGRVEYIEYWTNEKNKLSEKMPELISRNSENARKTFSEIENYEKYIDSFNNIIKYISGKNSLELETHRAANFEPLINAIIGKMEAVNSKTAKHEN